MCRLLSAALLTTLTLHCYAAAICMQDQPPQHEIQDDSRPYTSPTARKSVEVGNYYFRRKKYNAALSRYQEAVKTDSYYAPGYLGLGRVYEKIGLKKKALEAYRKYLETLPSAKQAEEAKEARKAIARLERQLKVPQTRRKS
jgi:tetratricopeptide (TPR) repeat protein